MNRNVLSHFGQTPRSKTAWWAMGMGLATLLFFPPLGLFESIIRPLMINIFHLRYPALGFFHVILAFGLSIAALILGIRGLRMGERSWAVWVGFAPAVLVGLFWIFIILGEFLFPH